MCMGMVIVTDVAVATSGEDAAAGPVLARIVPSLPVAVFTRRLSMAASCAAGAAFLRQVLSRVS